jgi:hypothetical protein
MVLEANDVVRRQQDIDVLAALIEARNALMAMELELVVETQLHRQDRALRRVVRKVARHVPVERGAKIRCNEKGLDRVPSKPSNDTPFISGKTPGILAQSLISWTSGTFFRAHFMLSRS